MNPAVEAIARAVLYEGYLLYPYRASAIKNRHRWTIGGLAPGASLRAECLTIGDASATLSVRVRFLHPIVRGEDGGLRSQVATEREVALPDHLIGELSAPRRFPFEFLPEVDAESHQLAVHGVVELSAQRVNERVIRIAVRVHNLILHASDEDRDATALRTIVAAHVELGIRHGSFVSLTDPPDDLRTAADGCRNEGVWPVLVGDPASRDTVLASPVILPDYPRIAHESPGDFFDCTEIDEMLALRVLTLTDDEKQEMVADPQARAILERVEALSADGLRDLHGRIRSQRPKPGDHVRLRPRGRADALDLILAGKAATVVSIEEDFEGTTYYAVTIDDDPGRDLGGTGQSGHRFFFRPEEIELLSHGEVR